MKRPAAWRPAGRVEHALTAAQLLRQRRQRRGLDARPARERRVVVRQRLDRRRAAYAARGGREERTLGPPAGALAHADVDLIRLDDVVGDLDTILMLARLGADPHSRDVRERADHVLRGQQPERELDVVTRRAHHDAERLAVQQELERLLRGDRVLQVLPRAATPA